MEQNERIENLLWIIVAIGIFFVTLIVSLALRS